MYMFNNYKNILLLGIGGIGISSLAKYLFYSNHKIYGYDEQKSEITNNLETLGIKIFYHSENLLNFLKTLNTNETLVIYSSAFKADHPIIIELKNKNFNLINRAKIISDIVNDKFLIAIAGTHGKTTTTSLISFSLKYANVKILSFIGGILKKFNSNLIYDENPQFCILEADEYDNFFLSLKPNIAIITSIEPDHFDTFPNKETLINSFKLFSQNVKDSGFLIIHDSIKNLFSNFNNLITYSINGPTNYVSNHKIENGFSYLTLNTIFGKFKDIKVKLYGEHNYENILASFITLKLLNVDNNEIISALENFDGIQRRFDIIYQNHKNIIINDYAHHPTEIKYVINTAKKLYPNKKISVIFQPHLYSRTLKLHKEFGEALSLADEVILFDIYPAREKNISNVSSKLILNQITTKKYLANFNSFKEFFLNETKEIILVLGAGDIYKIIPTLIKLLDKQNNEIEI